jgi:uncharacterized protein (TIGR02186 family)
MSGALAAIAGFFLAALASPPDVPPVALALTDEEVRVTAEFTGARLIIYGVAPAYEDGDDLVVILRGPDEPLRVMRKERRMGVWMNTAPVVFPAAPSYYAAASTRPLTEIAPPNVLQSLGIGAAYVPLRPGARTEQSAAALQQYREAVVRLKSESGLYRNEEGGVRIQTANLFRAEALLPSGAPVGLYQAQVVLFRNGEALARETTTLDVHRAGIGRSIYQWARSAGLAYGAVAVLIAVMAGWAAAAVFRQR